MCWIYVAFLLRNRNLCKCDSKKSYLTWKSYTDEKVLNSKEQCWIFSNRLKNIPRNLGRIDFENENVHNASEELRITMKNPISRASLDQGELMQTLLLNRVKVGKFILAFSSRKSLMFQRVWKVVWDIYLLKLDISPNKFVPQNL